MFNIFYDQRFQTLNISFGFWSSILSSLFFDKSLTSNQKMSSEVENVPNPNSVCAMLPLPCAYPHCPSPFLASFFFITSHMIYSFTLFFLTSRLQAHWGQEFRVLLFNSIPSVPRTMLDTYWCCLINNLTLINNEPQSVLHSPLSTPTLNQRCCLLLSNNEWGSQSQIQLVEVTNFSEKQLAIHIKSLKKFLPWDPIIPLLKFHPKVILAEQHFS